MATLKEIFEGNTSKVIEATELLKVLGDREGQFVWKQLTAEGGDFVAYVTADDENSYPNKGTQDGYYYVKFDPLTAIAENIREGVDIWGVIGSMKEGVSGIDFGTVTLTSTKSGEFKISHGLNAIPSIMLLMRRNTKIDYATSHCYGASKNRILAAQYDYGSNTVSVMDYPATSTATTTTVAVKAETFNTTWAIGTYDWVVIA